MLLNDMHVEWDNTDNDTRDEIAVLHTDGSGYWTRLALSVRVTGLTVPYINEDSDFGELRVHFNTDDWRTPRMGLIYTDKLFLREIRDYANGIGLAGADIEYSEQGMQGRNYVSFDVGAEFLKSWMQANAEMLA
jgi:hypothetical protein